MPLFKDLSTDSENIYIWEYSEEEKLDASELFSPEEQLRFAGYHPKKLSEVLMVRKMLKTYFPEYKIVYSEEGEPSLSPDDLQISITHSFPYAGIAVSREKIGIDLEPVRDKIIRVKHKVVYEEEQQFIPEDEETLYLTIIWSLKESLYKIHHSNYWSLKRHYEVKPFGLEDKSVACRVYDDHFSDEFTGRFWKFGEMIFTFVK